MRIFTVSGYTLCIYEIQLINTGYSISFLKESNFTINNLKSCILFSVGKTLPSINEVLVPVI